MILNFFSCLRKVDQECVGKTQGGINSNSTRYRVFDNHSYETRMVVERFDPVALSDSLN